ncbi:MAG: HAD-IIA family hydrolase [Mycobacteriaceae bacterium]
MSALRTEHDALLLDLDGTVYQGDRAVPGAVDVLADSRQRLCYVTNNASRSPADVVVKLEGLGFAASLAAVVTSSQSAARMLVERLPPRSRVLVVGTSALVEEVEGVGLVAVREAEDDPAAVVHGHSPDTGWRELAEATVAVRAGALWVATNTDPTLPSERGLLPGNGSMVGVVALATGRQPLVAGKPARPIMDDALARSGSERPLVVGDRLDTDIAGAHTVGARSLLVLTGVSTAADLIGARPEQRPDLVAPDLGGLDRPAAELALGAAVPGWTATAQDGVLVIRRTGGQQTASTPPGLAALRAACHFAWGSTEPDGGWRVRCADADAAADLERWGLSTPV